MPINIRNNADLDVSIPYTFLTYDISTVSASDGYSYINTSSPHFLKNLERVGVECSDTRFNIDESDTNSFIERVDALSFRFSNNISAQSVSFGIASVPVSIAITARRRENNQVTLQLSGEHRFQVNDIVVVSGLPSAWNGAFTITDAAPGGNTTRIRYNQSGADVLSFVADSGTAEVDISGGISQKQMLNNIANLTLSSNASRMLVGDPLEVIISDTWLSGNFTISGKSGSVISYSTAVPLKSVTGTAKGWTKALAVNVRANNTDNIVYPDLPIPSATTISFTSPLTVGSVLTANQTGNISWRYRTDSFSYQWARGTSTSGPWTNISGATSKTYTLTSSDSGFYINCLVTSTNSKGSVSSYAVSPPLFTAPLPAPTNLNVTNITNTTATLNWNSVTNATIYEYSVSTSTTFSTWTSVNNATTANITGLVHNTRYYFSVRAKRNSSDENGLEAAATEFITLVGPTTLSASIGLTTAANFGNVVLSNSVASGGGFAVAYSNYLVEYAAWNGSSWGSWISLGTYIITNTSPIITSLTDQTLYKFRSAAANSSGGRIGVYSAETSSVTPFGPPGAPTITSITLGSDGTSLTLNWNTSVTTSGASVVGWAVSRTTTDGPYTQWTRYVTASQSSHTFSSLTSNTSYTLSVKAIVGTTSQSGTAPTPFDVATDFSTNVASQTATTASVPSRPSAPSVTTTFDTKIGVSWTAPTDNGSAITEYRIQRSTDGVNWPADATYNTFTASTTSFDAISVDGDTNYYYRVRAVNGVGVSQWSLASAAGKRIKKVPDIAAGTTSNTGFNVEHNNIDNTNFSYTVTLSNVSPANSATSAAATTDPFFVTTTRQVTTTGSLGISNNPTGDPIPRLATATVGEAQINTSVTRPTVDVKVEATFTLPTTDIVDGSKTLTGLRPTAITTVTKAYQWQRSSTSTGTYTNISGATSASYTTTASDRNQWIRCRITYSATDATSTNLFSPSKRCAA